mmetsp:Transcript_6287/g.18032  ORF Transcript_6287/g.18032 Transcript_6287/m.18032 type:complete len:202 (-) Transcript_6287:89-694(-)
MGASLRLAPGQSSMLLATTQSFRFPSMHRSMTTHTMRMSDAEAALIRRWTSYPSLRQTALPPKQRMHHLSQSNVRSLGMACLRMAFPRRELLCTSLGTVMSISTPMTRLVVHSAALSVGVVRSQAEEVCRLQCGLLHDGGMHRKVAEEAGATSPLEKTSPQALTARCSTPSPASSLLPNAAPQGRCHGTRGWSLRGTWVWV